MRVIDEMGVQSQKKFSKSCNLASSGAAWEQKSLLWFSHPVVTLPAEHCSQEQAVSEEC